MIIDFQHHYTPPQLLKGKKNEVSVGIDENGNPMHLLNPLLGDIDAHVRMMDARRHRRSGALQHGRFRSAGSRHLPRHQ